MKTLNFVSTVCVAVLLATPGFVLAQDYRSPYGGSRANANQPRSFLGLPIPQQWSGIRPAATNQYSGQLPNGQRATGNSPNLRNGSGNLTNAACRNCSCPNGACANGLCASGQCSTCANGQCAGCANGQCGNGLIVSGNCPNGQCRLNQNPTARYNAGPNYGTQGDWSPRTTRSKSADPFGRADDQNANDNWTQRPALRNSVNDLYPSRYNQSDLELRRPYFNNQSGALNNSGSHDRLSPERDTRAPLPSDRSMFGAPVDRADGLARI